MLKSNEILKKFWGYNQFRPSQEDIVQAAIDGNDVLALLPTGGGKSICFQVPGLMREGICIVISPLIALMQDQVEQLTKRNIRAKSIVSGMSFREIDITLDNARFGGLDFLYTSPERIQTLLFKERFRLMKVALIVVDEAHCISEWGHDFRPPYRKIADLREIQPDVPIMALTATATQKVKEDIIQQLQLKNTAIFEASFQRNNISYEVYFTANKLNAITQLVKSYPNQTGILYCQTRKSVKELAQYLVQLKYKVGIYHGGMEKEERSQMLKAWLNNDIRIMVATNAFGMGIDKPDVRFVAHYEFPPNPEAYFQEAGRAGRDGLFSRTYVYYEENDIQLKEEQVNRQFPDSEFIKIVYRAMCNHLKIAIGSGVNESYSFDINSFCHQFKLPLFDSYQAIKILELNGDILLSENFFHPTKVKFAVGNRIIYGFQINHEDVKDLITLLSRSYPGIYDDFFEINIKEFTKRLRISSKELDKQLKYLEKNGIIDVVWKTDKPVVTFLKERLPDDYFHIDNKVYYDRKIKALLRWKAMKDFLYTEECREKYLLNYFGQNSEDCGRCDNCLENNKGNLTKNELVQLIKEELQEEKTFTELKNALNNVKLEQLKRCVFDLKKEEKIRVFNDKLLYKG
ncbi:MAG: RecQ family ATP-dependent DNA helicase [Flavobacteriia bacterium]|nr:RecQ family ATP-dependent DNA helicase [Flavobacteriia bacterium]